MEDSSGTVLDQASWNFSTSAPSGLSLEEDPASATNDWIGTNSTTPGAINDPAVAPLPPGHCLRLELLFVATVLLVLAFANDGPTGPGTTRAPSMNIH